MLHFNRDIVVFFFCHHQFVLCCAVLRKRFTASVRSTNVFVWHNTQQVCAFGARIFCVQKKNYMNTKMHFSQLSDTIKIANSFLFLNFLFFPEQIHTIQRIQSFLLNFTTTDEFFLFPLAQYTYSFIFILFWRHCPLFR